MSMARPGLRNHRKFRRLQALIKMPAVYVEAHLEAMWKVGYENGDALLGDAEDVELAAEWSDSRRKAGEWFTAVTKSGWVDEVSSGRYQIHDLLDHAPDYVRKRSIRHAERKNKGLRQETADNGGQWQPTPDRQSGNGGTPPPAPVPAPVPINTPQPPEGEQVVAAGKREPQKSPKRDADLPPGFVRFWSEYPAHDRKVGKSSCARFWTRKKLEAITEQVIASLERCKASRSWAKNGGEFIPGPESWLNKTPWETDPAEQVGAAAQAGDADPDNFVPVRPNVEDLPWNRGGK